MRNLPVYLLAIVWRLQGALTSEQPPSQSPQVAQDKASTLAIITLIAGIASWSFLPFIASLVGIATGWVEMSRIKSGQSSEAGRVITQIGLIASAVNLGLAILGGCVFMLINVVNLGLFGLLLSLIGRGATGAAGQ